MTQVTRLIVASVCMAGVAGYMKIVSHAEPVPIRESLSLCPMTISSWDGANAQPFDARTLEILGVDEYINRVYAGPHGTGIGLYVGYYGSQRDGDTMHSPLNCLPGAGWSPVRFDRIQIPVSAEPGSAARASQDQIKVNRYVIEKGLDRQLVLYWYQSHGRVVASEYWGKVYLVLDAIRQNRTDGALVRIIAPIRTTEEAAEQDAVDFARGLYPLLGRYLPS